MDIVVNNIGALSVVDAAEDAAEAYNKAARELHGEFINVRIVSR